MHCSSWAYQYTDNAGANDKNSLYSHKTQQLQGYSRPSPATKYVGEGGGRDKGQGWDSKLFKSKFSVE